MFLATGSSDKTIRVFELTSGDCHRVLTGHTDYITCLEFNAENSNYLASACESYLFFYRGRLVMLGKVFGELI